MPTLRSSRNRRPGAPHHGTAPASAKPSAALCRIGSLTVTLFEEGIDRRAQARRAPPSRRRSARPRRLLRPCGSAASSASISAFSPVRACRTIRRMVEGHGQSCGAFGDGTLHRAPPPASRSPSPEGEVFQDVRRALVAGEQIGAVLGADKGLQAPSPARAGGRDRPRRRARTPHRSGRGGRRLRVAGL